MKLKLRYLHYLQHPWLLTIHDLACNDDYVSFLIDYVEDGSLRDKLYAVSKAPLMHRIKYCCSLLVVLIIILD